MYYFIIFILGLVVGGGVVWAVRKKTFKPAASQEAVLEKKESLIEKQAREKEENRRKILDLLETQTPLTNNQVEELLGVSDATATRYLEDLEKEGKIRQVGKTGKYVCYERVN